MRKALVIAGVIGMIASGVASQAVNPLPPVPLEQYTLSNGLTVFLVEDHSVPIVAVNINYMVGSKNEKPGRTGFAHLFEHMMFQGSKNWNQDYFQPLQEVGGRVNGGTNTDRTRYWEQVPSAHLERALWLEADRMGFLLDALTQERLDNQISVVQNERRQNYENRPYGLVRETMAAAMYPPNHPYSWTTIGSIADLQAATIDDVKGFFRTYYAPNNATLCIAGDFDPDETKALVEKYFGAIPPGPPVTRLERWVPKTSGEVIIVMQDRVQLPRTYIAWHTVPLYSQQDAALDVFGRVLGGGRTSRLYRELVYEQQIAQDANAYHSSSELSGSMRFVLTPKPGHTLAEVEAAAQKVLDDAFEGGITAEELKRTQTAITAEFVRARQSVGGFGGISDQLNSYYHFLGEPDMYRWDLQRYLDLTPEATLAVARRLIGSDRVVIRVEPMAKLAASTSEAATAFDRSAMPKRTAEGGFTLPSRQRFTLANGLEVVLVEHHELPVVDLTLVARGGALLDPADRTGLASLTADLMPEGAGGRSAIEIANALEGLGAELDTDTATEASYVDLSVLKGSLDEGLAIFADVIMHPDFPEDELERQRRRRLVRLRQLKDQSRYVATVALQREVFGDHPYGRSSYGDAAGIGAITGDEVKEMWRQNFRPASSTLVVVGDLTRDELEESLKGNLATWRGKDGEVADPQKPLQRDSRTIYLIDKPGAAQSQISIGLVGAARDDENYATLQVMNMILGGQFMSRLNLNLREDKGYTYGARSSFAYHLEPGLFSASTSVQTDVTAPALSEMLLELEGIVGATPVTQEEMEFAKGSIIDGYAHRFETTGQISNMLRDEILYGLPENALEAYPVQIREVTKEQVITTAPRYLDLGALAIVIVGDLSVIQEDIEALGIGEVIADR